jgi:hypothetical protein
LCRLHCIKAFRAVDSALARTFWKYLKNNNLAQLLTILAIPFEVAGLLAYNKKIFPLILFAFINLEGIPC